MKATASLLLTFSIFSLFFIACSKEDRGSSTSVVTVADVGGNPDGVTVSDAGNIYITDIVSGEIKKVNDDGTVEIIADLGESSQPDGITAVTDANGNDILYVALIGEEGTDDGKIVKIDTSTSSPTIEEYINTTLIDPSGIAADKAGNLYVADESGELYKIDNDKNIVHIDPVSFGVDLEKPHGLTLITNSDNIITLYVTDQGSNSNNIVEIIYSTESDSVISAIEFTPDTTGGFQDGLLNDAKFKSPHGITTDKNGAIFVADEDNNRIAIITPGGNVVNFAGTGSAGDADGKADSAQFKNPRGMATLPNGDVLICDYGNGKVKKIVRD